MPQSSTIGKFNSGVARDAARALRTAAKAAFHARAAAAKACKPTSRVSVTKVPQGVKGGGKIPIIGAIVVGWEVWNGESPADAAVDVFDPLDPGDMGADPTPEEIKQINQRNKELYDDLAREKLLREHPEYVNGITPSRALMLTKGAEKPDAQQ